MDKETWTTVDRYFTEMLALPDAVLEETLRASAAAGLPEIQVSPNFGKLLMLLARLRGAGSILEIGTLGGYSTTWLARGMAAGGRLITLESNPRHADVARSNIARAGFSDRVEIMLGPALESLERLATEGRGPFDLIFIDADKPNNPQYFSWAMKLSRAGTLIIVDNVVRDGRVIDAASKDGDVRGVRQMTEMLRDSKLIATAIQTVGIKGYDGFVIALVTG
jgi:predicted O-methyltransferase YrrM